ncbi:MAG TPA: integrase arm-type DNA-binding domain-containing protein [Casimicrobiaceae bacterium]|nr:integrase arm-type DNA-binding domain-containing protein [Casimicrobiaceae bacterium]
MAGRAVSRGGSRVDSLTDKKARALRPRDDRAFKVADGRGLHLWVSPSGAKSWRLKFKLDGKERLMALGEFPDIDCEEARTRRDAARKLVARGVDPVEQRRKQRAEKTEAQEHRFRHWADAYYKKHAPTWSATHRADVTRILDELRASLGAKAMAAIEHSHVEQVLHKIERRGALHVARDARLYLRLVWRHYNQANPRARLADPSVDVVFDVELPAVRHHPAIESHEVGAMLRKIANSTLAPVVRFALRFLVLVAPRSGELRFARWDEIDTKARLWRIGETKMKSRKAHLVPLSKPVLELLAELRTLTGESELLFPSPFDSTEPLSEGTLIGAIKYQLGYRGEMTAHGARTLFSTWCSEQGFHVEAIERQLAHSPRDRVRDAYNRADYIEERRKMTEAWGRFCTESEAGAKIIPLRGERALS